MTAAVPDIGYYGTQDKALTQERRLFIMEMIQEPASESDQETEKMRKKRELRNQLLKSKRDNGEDKHRDSRAM